MKIILARVYDNPQPQGYRVLVDRLWPRGKTKQSLPLDEWNKTLAPSPTLRTWFNHQPEKWDEFSRRYGQELKEQGEEIKALLNRAKPGPLVLLYAAKDTQHTHALILHSALQQSKT